MTRAERFHRIFGTALVLAGGSVSLLGLALWLWARIGGSGGTTATIEDVLFHHSVVPPHFSSVVLESPWERVLGTDVPWFSFISGVLIACLGATQLYRASTLRSERLDIAEQQSRAKPTPNFDLAEGGRPDGPVSQVRSPTYLTARARSRASGVDE